MAKFTPETKEELKTLVKGEAIHLGDIDTSKITDMSYLFFYSQRTDFSGIEKWDVSNVENMSFMFHNCESFNADISSWDVSKVKYMSYMFSYCKNFNQPLNGWDVSGVENMCAMFKDCTSFNQNLSSWDTSNIEDMSFMFSGCKNFNQDISGWNINKVWDTTDMFENCFIDSKNMFLSDRYIIALKNIYEKTKNEFSPINSQPDYQKLENLIEKFCEVYFSDKTKESEKYMLFQTFYSDIEDGRIEMLTKETGSFEKAIMLTAYDELKHYFIENLDFPIDRYDFNVLSIDDNYKPKFDKIDISFCSEEDIFYIKKIMDGNEEKINHKAINFILQETGIAEQIENKINTLSKKSNKNIK
ncbi:TPA: BspA family leucine-rich repeat surface protein [Campylobacter jejuni]